MNVANVLGVLYTAGNLLSPLQIFLRTQNYSENHVLGGAPFWRDPANSATLPHSQHFRQIKHLPRPIKTLLPYNPYKSIFSIVATM